MAKLYSFMEINSRLSPTAAGFNSIGELSAYCKTFAQDVRVDVRSNITFNYFGGEEFAGSEGTQYLAALGNLGGYLNASGLHSGVVITTTLLAALQAMLDGTSGSYTYEVIDAGNIVTDTSTSWPDSFTIRILYSASVFDVTVWLTNETFRVDYPMADFEIVPPVDNCLDFINNFPVARFEIQNRTFDQHMNRAQSHLAGTLVTGFESVTLRIYNKDNLAEYFDCPFMIGYNGEKGVTFTNLIAAIQAFLLGLGGGYDLEDWLIAIPQLNAVGTYYIIPYWEGVAKPNPNPLLPPLQYNPIIPFIHGSNSQIADTIWTNYFQGAFIQNEFRQKLEYAVSAYKSAGFFVVPSSSNGGGSWYLFSEAFDDFVVASIASLPAMGISVITENVIRDIHDTLQAAEAYHLGDPVPEHPTPLVNSFTVETFNAKRYMTLMDTNNSAKIYVLIREDYENI